jgi:hypothetical protein
MKRALILASMVLAACTSDPGHEVTLVTFAPDPPATSESITTSAPSATTAVSATTRIPPTTTSKTLPLTTIEVTTVAPRSPVTMKGSNDAVIDVAWPTDTPAIVTFKHPGTSNFFVHGLNADNDDVAYVVNALYDRTGTVLFNMEDKGVKRFDVTADGPWTLTLSPISTARRFDGAASGRDHDVLIYDGPPAVMRMVTTGSDSNVMVHGYGSRGTSYLVNEIGNIDVTFAIKAGPIVIEVDADGPWAFSAPT